MTKLYNINSQFFDNIDLFNETTLYVLGWFFVRGCISKSGLVRLQVQSYDSYILEKIKDAMEYTGPLHYSNNRKSVLLCINNRHIADTLVNYRNQPASRFLFSPHFVRALFDACGTISFHKHKYLNLSIILFEELAQELRQFLLNHLGIRTHHYYKSTYTNTLQVIVTKCNDCIKFFEFIYRGCDSSIFFLARKFDIYNKFVCGGV